MSLRDDNGRFRYTDRTACTAVSTKCDPERISTGTNLFGVFLFGVFGVLDWICTCSYDRYLVLWGILLIR